MSYTKLDVELDLEAIKKENEKNYREANEKLISLKKHIEEAKNIVQESPEQIEQLKKKLGDAHKITTQLDNDFKLLDEEDEEEVYYAEEKRKVEEAQRNERSIDEQLKALTQKFEQAKQDEIRLKKEIEVQQQEVQKFKRIIEENNNSQTESFKSQPTKSFGSSNGTNKFSNKEIFEEKKKEAFKQLKSLCEKPNTKYSYNDKNQEVTFKGKGGIINFTKNGASTNSDNDEDVYAMARDLFDAYIKDENDLKKVKFNPSGPKEETLKNAIAELKAAKLKEFQDAKLKKPESHLNVDEESTKRFTNSSFSRS